MIRGELFNQDMVKAFLKGRKTRTSRPIKPQPTRAYWCGIGHGWDDGHGYEIKPKHRIGDIIYARETWNCIRTGNGQKVPFKTEYWYKANNDFEDCADEKWRPSIHMSREAARLWFKVTDVKVQKLDDVTEQDAVEDGFKYRGWSPTFNDPDSGGDGECETPLDQFQDFWLKQYGDNQPWMWVYYLKLITKEEAQNEQ
jgi:hypothetical protein